MVKNPKLAATLAVAMAFGVVAFSMWTRHSAQSTNQTHTQAAALEPIDDGAIEKALHDNNLALTDVSVRNVGGIVILRGSGDAASAERAVSIVKSMGPQRVANLITAKTNNDAAIQREAERELASTGSLDGCVLHVHCENGVLSVTGTVQHELQKDAARSALKAVRGPKEVRVDLDLAG